MKGKLSALGATAGSLFTACYFYDPRRTETFTKFADSAVSFLHFLDPEQAHGLTIKLCKMGLIPKQKNLDSRLHTRVWDMEFDSPLGLAAGFDKQAEAVGNILEMGFGFVEVGGVTPLSQPGNAKPRMFRLTEDKAVINRFGLNSDGASIVADRLKNSREYGLQGRVGVNLAKNTSSDDAKSDYIAGVEKLGPHVDFIVLNVSCPNVKWTSKMGGGDIADLVDAVRTARDQLLARPPLLLKLGPDMSMETKQSMAQLAIDSGVDGLVISNTTKARPESLQSIHAKEQGGLSGDPLTSSALETLRDMYEFTEGKIPIVGVGGISSGKQAYERIRAGASLIQIYTALVFEGPGLIKKIHDDLITHLEQDGFSSIADAVGADFKNSKTGCCQSVGSSLRAEV